MGINITCDKCNKVIDKENFETRYIRRPKYITLEFSEDTFLFCNKCLKDFYRWLK